MAKKWMSPVPGQNPTFGKIKNNEPTCLCLDFIIDVPIPNLERIKSYRIDLPELEQWKQKLEKVYPGVPIMDNVAGMDYTRRTARLTGLASWRP